MQIVGAYNPRQWDNQMPGPQIHVDPQVLTLLLVQGDQTPRKGVTARMDEMSLLLLESALLVSLTGEPANS